MKNIEKNTTLFEMIPEGENSLSIKRVYPNTISTEEKEKIEQSTPQVILHCFNAADIKELQELGEKLAMQHLACNNTNVKKTTSLNFFSFWF